MDILLGVGTFAATALLFCLAYGAHRRPVPARWTRLPALSMLICVAMTLLLPASIGFVIKGLLTPGQSLATHPIEVMAIVGALVVAAIALCPMLIRPARQAIDVQPPADNRNAAPSAEAPMLAA